MLRRGTWTGWNGWPFKNSMRREGEIIGKAAGEKFRGGDGRAVGYGMGVYRE